MSLQKLLSWVTKLLFWQSPSVVEVPTAADLLLFVVVKITKCTLIQQGTFSETISYVVPTPNHGTCSVPMSNSPPMSLARHCYFLPCSLTRVVYFKDLRIQSLCFKRCKTTLCMVLPPGAGALVKNASAGLSSSERAWIERCVVVSCPNLEAAC